MKAKELQGRPISWNLDPLRAHYPDWIDAIAQRKSTTQYNGQPIPPQVFENLYDLAQKLNAISPLFRIDVQSGASDDIFINQFGKFRGTSGFAAFISERTMDEECMRTLGFLGEFFVLHAVHLGLSTCWIGNINSMIYVSRKVPTQAGERIHCILPLGYPGTPLGIARARQRTAWKNICPQFNTGELTDWQRAAFEAARWSPSAHNRQPWSFSVWENRVRVKRRSGAFGKWVDTDCGVAMSHIHLIADASGNLGKWHWGEYPVVAELSAPVAVP